MHLINFKLNFIDFILENDLILFMGLDKVSLTLKFVVKEFLKSFYISLDCYIFGF